MKLLNTRQLSKMTEEEIINYKAELLMNIEDSILVQAFSDDTEEYIDIDEEVTCEYCGHINHVIDVDFYCMSCDAHL